MRFLAAIALLALAVPAIAQRGGAHAGLTGHSGGSGYSGFSRPSGISGSTGISRPGNFVRPAQPVPYSGFGSAGFQGNRPPIPSRLPAPYRGSGFNSSRPAYRLGSAAESRGAPTSNGWNRNEDRNRDRDRDRDHDRWDARRRSFANWYASIYPTWPFYGYPYLIDPGFYDWGNSDDAANDQGAVPDYPYPYPDNGNGAGYGGPDQGEPQGYPEQLPPWNSAYASVAAPVIAPSLPQQPLTVIFKTGRTPAKINNYMMTAKLLIDLDAQHYEQIPLDQIDLAATERVNSAAGVVFQIPGASRD